MQIYFLRYYSMKNATENWLFVDDIAYKLKQSNIIFNVYVVTILEKQQAPWLLSIPWI